MTDIKEHVILVSAQQSQLPGSADAADLPAHAANHQYRGSDQINVTLLEGLLADPQKAGYIAGLPITDELPMDQQALVWSVAEEKYIWATAGIGGGEANTTSNAGFGVGQLAKAKMGVNLPIKSIKAGTNIAVANGADEVTISSSAEANTNSNVGGGAGLVKPKEGTNTPIKSLVAGTGTILAEGDNTVTINSTGEANTNTNAGAGFGLVKDKVGVNTPIKTLLQGDNILMTENGDSVIISLNPDNYNDEKEPTGFATPKEMDVWYDPTTRMVTLTGSVKAKFKGILVPELVADWVSPALPDAAPAETWYLRYNGSAFEWTTESRKFSELQIAYAIYNAAGDFIYGQRENHGLAQDHTTHREFHDLLGTYRDSGADISGVVLESVTAADKRPIISEATILDEDLPTVLAAKTDKALYSHVYLSGTGAAEFMRGTETDIVPLDGAVPQYNEWNGAEWVLSDIPVNSHSVVWMIGAPVSKDTESQKMRYTFAPAQSVGTLNAMEALSPADMTFGEFEGISSEFVYLHKFIIRRTASSWEIRAMQRLYGSRAFYGGSPAGGNYISSVAIDPRFGSGNGTATNALSFPIPTVISAAAYLVSSADVILFVQYTDMGEVTITLPTVEAVSGRPLTIKDTGQNCSVHNIVILTEGSETIEGESDAVMSADGASWTLVADSNGNWGIQ